MSNDVIIQFRTQMYHEVFSMGCERTSPEARNKARQALFFNMESIMRFDIGMQMKMATKESVTNYE